MIQPHAGTEPPTPRHDLDHEAVHLLRSLVEIPSESRRESAAAAFLARSMELLGLRASLDRSGSVIGVRGCTSPRAAEIILLGHIDTVPGDVPVRVVGDCLFGRGTVDAKGPLAAFAVAAARTTLDPRVRLKVIGAVEEEIATSAGARLASERDRPAACIIGEPSGMNGVTIGYKGRLIAHLSLQVPSSHSAGPCPTAGETAFTLWRDLASRAESLAAGAGRAFDQLQHRLASVRTSSDGLDETADLSIGFRLPPSVSPGDVEDLCRRSAQGLAANHRWSFTGHERAYVADRSNAVVRALGSAIRTHAGTPRVKLKTGTSDMNIVAPAWGCPIAAYGPGDSSLDHTPNEHIRLSEYLGSIGVLTTALESLSHEIAAHQEERTSP